MQIFTILYPAVQIFGKAKSKTGSPTPTPLPANATGEELMGAMMGAGLWKALAVLVALVIVGGFALWAWGEIQGGGS